MFKFFRKYNKYILAVGGTLLLIMFLINVPFESLIGGMGAERATWATVGPDGEEITNADLRRLHRELQLHQAVGVQIGTPDKLDRPEYWYLLVREADEAGLVPVANLGMLGVPRENIAALCATTGESEDFVLETLAKVDGVRRLMQSSLGGGRWSDRRLKHEAQRSFLRVTVQPVVIEARPPADPPHFSDDELKQQLDKYADLVPGEGDAGFGYRLPDRAKLEWLAVPADSVRTTIEQSGKLDAVALRKHWRQHAAKFGPPQADADVPESVRADYLSELVGKTLDDIAKDAGDQLRIDRRGLAQRGGYFEIPEGWTGRSFQDLALDLQKNYGIPLPEYQATGDRWLTNEDLAELPGIATAASDKFGDRPIGLPDLVMAARELQGSSTIPMQAGIAGPVLRGNDRSVYIFRITAADKSRPPRDLDEIRDRVVADLSKLAAYRELVAQAEEIRSQAISEGMLATAIAHGTTVGRNVSFSLNNAATASFPGLGPSKEAAEVIIDRAIALPADKPLAELPETDLVAVVPVERKLALLVSRLVDRTPVTAETYRSYVDRGTVQAQLLNAEITGDTAFWDAFKYAALAQRHSFKFAEAGAEAEADADATPIQPVPAQAGN